MPINVICPYCKQPAKLVSGAKVYPYRPDLHIKKFYLCEPCKAYVGCHPNTERPLGRLANKELRIAKVNAHAAFDPIWKTKKMGRRKAYKWLAEKLNIDPKKCHIGMFDVETCNKVVEVCKVHHPIKVTS